MTRVRQSVGLAAVTGPPAFIWRRGGETAPAAPHLERSPSWVLSSRSVASGWPRRSTASCCARPEWPVARPAS